MIGCNQVHRSEKTYGENLFRSPAQGPSGQRNRYSISATDVVDAWASEKQSYDTNSCQTNECDHYTQVIHAQTQEIGCATAVCADQSQVWVCNYNPSQ